MAYEYLISHCHICKTCTKITLFLKICHMSWCEGFRQNKHMFMNILTEN